MGGVVRRAIRRRPPRRAGDRPGASGGHGARGRGGDAGAQRRRRAAGLHDAARGRAWARARRDRRRPGHGDHPLLRGPGGRRADRGQRRDGRAEGVPPRQRAEPDQPQRAVHGDHREHDERPDDRDPREGNVQRDALLGGRTGDASASRGPRHQDRRGLRQARTARAVRPPGRGGGRRPHAAGEAAADRARRAGSHVLQARADPLDPPRPAAAGVHPGAGDAAGQRAAPERGTGRLRDGAGARRALGGRVRDGRPASRSPRGRSRRSIAHRSRRGRAWSSRSSAPTPES